MLKKKKEYWSINTIFQAFFRTFQALKQSRRGNSLGIELRRASSSIPPLRGGIKDSEEREDPSHVGLSFKPHVLRKSKNAAATSVRNAVLLGSFLTDDIAIAEKCGVVSTD